MVSPCQFYSYNISGGFLYCLLKFFVLTVVDLTSTKPGFLPVLVLPIPLTAQSISRPAFLPFQKAYGSCLTGLPNITVLTFVWSLPASIGSLFSTSYRRTIFLLPFPIPCIQNHERATKLTARMQNGFVTFTCVTWSNLPLFHR